MTLTVMYKAGGNVFMMSDVLVSSRRRSLPVPLPTRETAYRHPDSTYPSPSGLVQKLAFINKKIVLGWADSVLQASAFVKYLREKIGDRELTPQEISDILDAYPEENLTEVQAFLTVDLGYDVGSFEINTGHYEMGGIAELWCLGSGSGDFYRFADTKLQDPMKDKPGADISDALYFMGQAMASQAFSGYGLDNGWGAGFQAAIRNPNGYGRLDRVLIRAWVAHSPHGQFQTGRGPFFYLFYRDNDLFVCRVYGTDGGSFSLVPTVDEFFAREKAVDFPYGYHRPEWVLDVIHKPGTNSFPYIVTPILKGPSCIRMLQGKPFYVDVSKKDQSAVRAFARRHFST